MVLLKDNSKNTLHNCPTPILFLMTKFCRNKHFQQDSQQISPTNPLLQTYVNRCLELMYFWNRAMVTIFISDLTKNRNPNKKTLSQKTRPLWDSEWKTILPILPLPITVFLNNCWSNDFVTENICVNRCRIRTMQSSDENLIGQIQLYIRNNSYGLGAWA